AAPGLQHVGGVELVAARLLAREGDGAQPHVPQRLERRVEGLPFEVRRQRAPQRAARDGRRGGALGQGAQDAARELARDQLPARLLLAALARRDVAHDARVADEVALGVAREVDADAHVHQGAVLAAALRLVVAQRALGPKPVREELRLVGQVGRKEHLAVLPQDFLLGVAEEALRARVPREEAPLRVDGHDGVVRALHGQEEPRAGVLRAAALGDVDAHRQDAGRARDAHHVQGDDAVPLRAVLPVEDQLHVAGAPVRAQLGLHVRAGRLPPHAQGVGAAADDLRALVAQHLQHVPVRVHEGPVPHARQADGRRHLLVDQGEERSDVGGGGRFGQAAHLSLPTYLTMTLLPQAGPLAYVTRRLYLEDAYLRACDATVLRAEGNRVVLDQTVLYAESGGQAADHGVLRWDGGEARAVDSQIEGGGHVGDVSHTLEGGTPPAGARVRVEVDWPRRYGLMLHHTAAHLIAAVVYRDFKAKFTG